jgi:peptidoglycan/xylan/chitin deacetylase (PgdA/CDA1 family)
MVRRKLAPTVAVLLAMVLAWGGGAAAEASAPSARVVSHGSRVAPTIALTFDDGSSPQNCRRILAVLVAQGVPATFFPMAAAIRLDPAFWHLVASAGYPIGDHTMTHPHLPRLGYAAQLRQMTSSRNVVESLLHGPMLDVFRPPYGEYDGRTEAAAGAAGFPTLLLWDVDPRDWSSSDTMPQKLAAAEQGTNGSVVLFHCGPNATPYLLPDVIAFYRDHGFRFVTVPALLGLTWSPGPTASVSPSEILGGLSALPSSPFGGAIVDINGRYPPDPSGPPLGLPSATPASASNGPSTSPEGSGVAPPTAAATGSPSGGPADGVGPGPIGLVLLAFGLALVALLLGVGATRVRR